MKGFSVLACGPCLRFFLMASLFGSARPGLSLAEERPSPPEPPVALDQLLQLPDSLDYGMERRGGATRGEWRERFREAEAALQEARSTLKESEVQLERLGESSEAWQLAPPGGGPNTSEAPLSYQLKMQIRRHQGEVERAEKRLRDLEIEANLASVPEDWRR